MGGPQLGLFYPSPEEVRRRRAAAEPCRRAATAYTIAGGALGILAGVALRGGMPAGLRNLYVAGSGIAGAISGNFYHKISTNEECRPPPNFDFVCEPGERYDHSGSPTGGPACLPIEGDEAATMGNLWQMPYAPPGSADRFMPGIPAPRPVAAWRMPRNLGPTYALPLNFPPFGNLKPGPFRQADTNMPPRFEPRPFPTPLRRYFREDE